MDIELARSRAILIDKGFEYHKLYKIELQKSAAKDSILAEKDHIIEMKTGQADIATAQFRNEQKISMNNLELAKTWKKKATSRSFKIVAASVGAFVFGYLVGK